MTEDSKARIAAAYNAAADRPASPVVADRAYFGARAVERAGLRPGEFVLDVCCGAGSSAIPAARAVGPAGRVIAVDIAEAALAAGRQRAQAEGLQNVEFRAADFEQVYFRDASFDAVICVFGIFFLPDMTAALKKMWRYLRAGGRVVIATRAEGMLEPASGLFWSAVRRERPELEQSFVEWRRLSTAEQLRALCREAGLPAVEPEAEDHPMELASAEAYWELVMGSGYRGVVDQLTEEQRERVRAACMALDTLRLESPVWYAVAAKT